MSEEIVELKFVPLSDEKMKGPWCGWVERRASENFSPNVKRTGGGDSSPKTKNGDARRSVARLVEK